VKELSLEDDGILLIPGKNSRLKIGFYYVEFMSIVFTIEDTKLNKMSVSSVVEGFTDNEVIIEIKAVQESQGQKQTELDVSDISDFERLFKKQRIDLRTIDRLDMINDGKILIGGENSRLLLGFHNGDFTFIKFTIEDTKLSKMKVRDAIEHEISIKVLVPDER
jgi:hypothetical protein